VLLQCCCRVVAELLQSCCSVVAVLLRSCCGVVAESLRHSIGILQELQKNSHHVQKKSFFHTERICQQPEQSAKSSKSIGFTDHLSFLITSIKIKIYSSPVDDRENQFVDNNVKYFLKYSFRVWNRTLKCRARMYAYLYSQVSPSPGFTSSTRDKTDRSKR
jgi:hypothetical protein